jgi:hypothetical protein
MRPRLMISIVFIALLLVIPRSLVAAGEPKMTDAQLKKILTLIDQAGHKTTIDLEPATALGIDTKLPLPPLPSIGSEDDQSFGHQFSILPEDQGYLLGRIKLGNTENLAPIEAYRVNPELGLVAAITFRKGGFGVLTLSPDEANLGVDRELAFWARYADDH